jgi:hypothetical protein
MWEIFPKNGALLMPDKKFLLTAVARILRPLVRILLRQGVPYQSFSELARWVYVDVARREFQLPGKKQTRSRISVVTGLSRKEVLRLVDQSPPIDDSAAERHHRAARIISAWLRQPAYLDAGGQPLRLSFDGPQPSFSQLVQSQGGDVPSRAVLDELLRVGAVVRDEDGHVLLSGRAYLPTGAASDAERYAILGQDVAALLNTIDHNLHSEPAKRYFQRKVAYRGVPAAVVPAIRAAAGSAGQQLLENLDHRLAQSLEPGSVVDNVDSREVLFGIYWFEDDGSGAQSAGEIS